MNTGTIVAIVVVIVVLLVVAFVVRAMMRRRRLQEQFGPEYDRAVETHDSRMAAERELVEREKRHAQLELRPLDPQMRERYREEWMATQARFVDEPDRSVADADRLVTEVMAERGYPTEGFDQQVADLSIEHAATLDRYRTAHDIRQRMDRREASTEDLRNAMVHYRALFAELLEVDSDAHLTTGDAAGRGVGPDRTIDPGSVGRGSGHPDQVRADSGRVGGATDARGEAGTGRHAARMEPSDTENGGRTGRQSTAG